MYASLPRTTEDPREAEHPRGLPRKVCGHSFVHQSQSRLLMLFRLARIQQRNIDPRFPSDEMLLLKRDILNIMFIHVHKLFHKQKVQVEVKAVNPTCNSSIITTRWCVIIFVYLKSRSCKTLVDPWLVQANKQWTIPTYSGKKSGDQIDHINDPRELISQRWAWLKWCSVQSLIFLAPCFWFLSPCLSCLLCHLRWGAMTYVSAEQVRFRCESSSQNNALKPTQAANTVQWFGSKHTLPEKNEGDPQLEWQVRNCDLPWFTSPLPNVLRNPKSELDRPIRPSISTPSLGIVFLICITGCTLHFGPNNPWRSGVHLSLSQGTRLGLWNPTLRVPWLPAAPVQQTSFFAAVPANGNGNGWWH